jgi:hypothetical protein
VVFARRVQASACPEKYGLRQAVALTGKALIAIKQRAILSALPSLAGGGSPACGGWCWPGLRGRGKSDVRLSRYAAFQVASGVPSERAARARDNVAAELVVLLTPQEDDAILPDARMFYVRFCVYRMGGCYFCIRAFRCLVSRLKMLCVSMAFKFSYSLMMIRALLDTNAFYENKWRKTQAMDTFADLCRARSVQCFIPHVVFREIVSQGRVHQDREISAIRAAIRKLKNIASPRVNMKC